MPSNDSPLFWNEFQWEEEIRRDERRICGYFHELPSCLDLPGEEEMIYEKLFSQVDLMPVNGKTGALRNWDDGEDEEEWEASYKEITKLVDELNSYVGCTKDADRLYEFLDKQIYVVAKWENLYVYAYLVNDQELGVA